jgi:regulator of sirC expression with transglutaminase-like and TPR domain
MTQSARERFAVLAAAPEERIDLIEAALLIAAEADPHLDPQACHSHLQALAHLATERLKLALTAEERAAALIRFLHEEQGFSGNHADYYHPGNSFLPWVLERRRGIPITLALLYLEVGRRLGLRLEGINFPGHFLVKYVEGEVEILIDPFAGRILDTDDCLALLRASAGPAAVLEPALLRPAAPKVFLRRMLTNLKQIYLRQERFELALSCCERILLLLPDDPFELRDRGLLYARLECYPEARADLERYLTLVPGDPSAPAVRASLEEIRRRAGTLI